MVMEYGRAEDEQFEVNIVNGKVEEAYDELVTVLKDWYALMPAAAPAAPATTPRSATKSTAKHTPSSPRGGDRWSKSEARSRSASKGVARALISTGTGKDSMISKDSMEEQFEEMAQLREELWSVNDTLEVLMAEAAESEQQRETAEQQRDSAREQEGKVQEQAVANVQALEEARRQMAGAMARAQRAESRLEVVTAEREEALKRCIGAGSKLQAVEAARQEADRLAAKSAAECQRALAKAELVTAEREEALRRCVTAEANTSIDRAEGHVRAEEENNRLLMRLETVTAEREEYLRRLALAEQHRQEPQWDELDQLEHADAEAEAMSPDAQARRMRLDANIEAERMEAVLQGAAERARADAAEQALGRAREQLAVQAAKYEKELDVARTTQQLLAESVPREAADVSITGAVAGATHEPMTMSAQLLGQAQTQEFEARMEVVTAERDEALRRCEEALRLCAERERTNKVLERAMVEGQRQMYAEARRGEQVQKEAAAKVGAAKQEAEEAGIRARRDAAAALHETQVGAELERSIVGHRAEEELLQLREKLRSAQQELARMGEEQNEVQALRAEAERSKLESKEEIERSKAEVEGRLKEVGELQSKLHKRVTESLTGPEIEMAVSPMLGKCMQAVEFAEHSASAKQSELEAVSGELEHVKSTSLGAAELGELHAAMVTQMEEHETLKQQAQAMATELLRAQSEVARLAMYEHPSGGYKEERQRAITQATMEAQLGARSEREDALRAREEEVLSAAESWVSKGETAVATLKAQLGEVTAREAEALDGRVKAIEELRAVRMKLMATEEARTVAVAAWREAESRAEREQAKLRGEAVERITKMQSGFDAQLQEHVSVAVRQVEEQKQRALEDQRALAKQVQPAHVPFLLLTFRCFCCLAPLVLYALDAGLVVDGSSVSQEGRAYLPTSTGAGAIAARIRPEQ
jgi:hypothetical protein